MKISELTNAPQWLKDATVENEDVVIENGLVIWQSGTWKDGIWQDGIWKDGIWQDGIWQDGTWQSGIWKTGITSCKSKYIPMIYPDRSIKIGCEIKTIEEWDKWFAGTEEFATRRGTLEFKMIYAHYCATKAYVEAMR